jgi:hypothetical protein
VLVLVLVLVLVTLTLMLLLIPLILLPLPSVLHPLLGLVLRPLLGLVPLVMLAQLLLRHPLLLGLVVVHRTLQLMDLVGLVHLMHTLHHVHVLHLACREHLLRVLHGRRPAMQAPRLLRICRRRHSARPGHIARGRQMWHRHGRMPCERTARRRRGKGRDMWERHARLPAVTKHKGRLPRGGVVGKIRRRRRPCGSVDTWRGVRGPRPARHVLCPRWSRSGAGLAFGGAGGAAGSARRALRPTAGEHAALYDK